MAVIADLNNRGAGKILVQAWGRERESLRVQYDFAKDGGAVGEYAVIEAAGALLIESAKFLVRTAVVGSSSTVSLGKSADLAGVIAAIAEASLVAASVSFGAAQDASHVLADGDKLYMAIGTGALTAGKIDILLELQSLA